jgi:hypothetical protein
MARRYHFEARTEPEGQVDGRAKHHRDAPSEALCGQHAVATRAAPMPLGPPHESLRSQAPSPRQNFLLAMLAEFGRANAAAQRYEDLRYRSASRESIAAGDIPRRVFEEFYSGKAEESRRPQVVPIRSAGRGMQPGKGVVVD